MNNENVILVQRVKRGRPSKAKPVIDLDAEPKRRGRPSKEKETKDRVPIGRPRTVDIIDKVAYQKEYYLKNKDKYKGDYSCPHCNLLCSYSNKSRHMKKHHLNLKEKSSL